MTQRLFGRQVIVQIGQPGEEGRSWSELRVDFQVDYKTGKSGKAAIDVYNIGKDGIAAAREKGALVRLLAGYNQPKVIFEGNPLRRNGVELEPTGTDVIMKLQLRDGASTLSTSRVNLTFEDDIKLSEAIKEVTLALGIPRKAIRLAADPVLPAGTVLKGPAREVLNVLLTSEQDEWHINRGGLQVLDRSKTTTEEAVVFSSKTGNLIGNPRKKSARVIEITGLLEGSIRPGRRFLVESLREDGSFARATYKATDVSFNGSRWENDFYVQLTGKEVS